MRRRSSRLSAPKEPRGVVPVTLVRPWLSLIDRRQHSSLCNGRWKASWAIHDSESPLAQPDGRPNTLANKGGSHSRIIAPANVSGRYLRNEVLFGPLAVDWFTLHPADLPPRPSRPDRAYAQRIRELLLQYLRHGCARQSRKPFFGSGS